MALAGLLALPLAVMTARNLAAPKPLAWLAKGVLDVARSIHTLVFGLVLVGIVGLGPTAGILAIGLHSMGPYGKLFAEAIESLDMAAIDAVRSVGAGPAGVFVSGWFMTVPVDRGRACVRSAAARSRALVANKGESGRA